jgi:hypothetical protein
MWQRVEDGGWKIEDRKTALRFEGGRLKEGIRYSPAVL